MNLNTTSMNREITSMNRSHFQISTVSVSLDCYSAFVDHRISYNIIKPYPIDFRFDLSKVYSSFPNVFRTDVHLGPAVEGRIDPSVYKFV